MYLNPKIKILLVADLNDAEKGPMRLRAMSDLGGDITAISHTRLRKEGQGDQDFSLGYRIAHKFGVCLDTEKINTRIPEIVGEQNFDVVWIEKGNMVNPATLRFVKSRTSAARLVWYSEDDMFLKHNRSRAFARGLPLYDHVFTTKARNCRPEELPAMGARRVSFVDKGFDPGQHCPVDVTAAERERLGGDVGFVGTYERERGNSMLFLAANGIRVRVWGNGWETFPRRHENLVIERRAVVNSRQDLTYTKAICATRINLAFLRKLNRDRQTDRTVEIPACGGFMLAERSDDHRRLFEEGREAEFFASDGELLEKVRYYMDHDADRQRVADAGRRRCLEGDYSHLNRVRFMLSEVLDRRI